MKEKEEEAIEDNVETAIYEDEENAEDINSDDDEDDDEDYDCQENMEDELYDSKLDNLDEVLFFRDTLASLQTNRPQIYDYLISCLDANEQNSFNASINKAMEYAQAAQQT